jgi:hypothetical protein
MSADPTLTHKERHVSDENQAIDEETASTETAEPSKLSRMELLEQ